MERVQIILFKTDINIQGADSLDIGRMEEIRFMIVVYKAYIKKPLY